MAQLRRRISLQEVEQLYTSGRDPSKLENLIRAFATIQAKDYNAEDSFFMIGGYHGEPFRDPDPDYDPSKNPNGWWGGYCNHGNVLFPLWHRAYLMRLEDALRRVPGCQDVTIPFWDECLPFSKDSGPVPKILTDKKFVLDGKEIDNPLYSYKLPIDVTDKFSRDKDAPNWPDGQPSNRYTKHKNYQTCRFPSSGLVGTETDRKNTDLWNSRFGPDELRTSLLNGNIANWLSGDISKDITAPNGERIPDTSSVLARFKSCLEAPNFTLFSNKTSADNYNKTNDRKSDNLVISLEMPHNAMHLAVGGFYQDGVYIADGKHFIAGDGVGANGDMGDNETASLDPIFFFHHAFIDYTFWTWQKKHGVTAEGSITIDSKDPGAQNDVSQPGLPSGTELTLETPLRPFKKPGHKGTSDADFVTSADVVDIEKQLGVTYGHGSLDPIVEESLPAELFGPIEKDEQPWAMVKSISNIHRAQYRGSFVIRTYATTPSGKQVEVGREPVLSRWNIEGCANCQNSLQITAHVPVHQHLAAALREGKEDHDVKWEVKIQTGGNELLSSPPTGGEPPVIDTLWPLPK